MIFVAVPSDELRERLDTRLGDARIIVWRPGAPDALPGPTDLLVLPYMLPAAELRHLDGLPIRVIQSQTLGYDGVADHLPDGAVYCNAVEVHEGSTAELALALTLSMLRGIPKAIRDADHSQWDHRRHPGLAGRRVLILGAGGVGREISHRLAPFGAAVDVVARRPRTGVHGSESLPDLLPRADVVIVAVPLSDDTRGLVDTAFLATMKAGALLVNVSRGAIVDTDALVAALRQERIRAALDVTDPEPLPRDHPALVSSRRAHHTAPGWGYRRHGSAHRRARHRAGPAASRVRAAGECDLRRIRRYPRRARAGIAPNAIG